MPEGDLHSIEDVQSSAPQDAEGEQGSNPDIDPMTFRLADLVKGVEDPRGRKVLDILWSVDEFKIYKTDQGISPFFSDNPQLSKRQKMAYIALGPDLAAFNHLIHTLKPRNIPFTDQTMGQGGIGSVNLVHYERELARCIAQALLGQAEIARNSLTDLRRRLAARISNRGRVVHLMINVVLVAIAVAGAILFARSNYTSVFQFNVIETGLAIMMGSVGALFSTTVRLQSMEVDPTVSPSMHWIYGAQRVLVGALGALIIYYGFKSGVVAGLFQPVSGAVDLTQNFNPYWLSFVCVLAGFSERLVPNLLDTKAASIDEGAAG